MKSVTRLFLLATLFAVGCAKFFSHSPNTEKDVDVISGQLVIKFDEGSEKSQYQSILAQFDQSEVLDQKKKIYVVKDSALAGKEKSVAADLEKNGTVVFAEPNFRVSLHNTTSRVPQDPLYLKLWGLKNYGQDSPNGIEGTESADIGAMDVWSQTTTGSNKIKVAVLDTGIDYKHPDLAANMWVNQKEKDGVPGVDDDGNGYVDDLHGWDAISDKRSTVYFGQIGDPDPMDDQGHGTHVAGTIGAVGGNGIGVVGVNWSVSLVAVKFLDANGSGSSVDEYRAMQYILANDIDIVNGSYGGGAKSKLIESAIVEANEKGILFVFAAGNESSNNDATDTFPTNYESENIISVAATDARDQIADFSNYGQTTVDIAAPGVNILSTVPTKIGGDYPYAAYSGTSMAAPHVAGAAALLLAAEPGLRKNPAAIRERLMKTAECKHNLSAMVASGGRLSVARAVKSVTTGHPALAGQWQELPYQFETPRYPQKRVDNSWAISVPGAKAIRVHIKSAQIEETFDVARIYDGQYRYVMNISGLMHNTWSPIILGDTAHVKFSNSMVSIDGGAPFANFNSEGLRIDKVEVLK